MFAILIAWKPVSAESFIYSNVENLKARQLFGLLISDQEPDPNLGAQAAAAAMSALLAYMAPSIKNMPGYAGYFAGNCSVFFDNKTIRQVGCDMTPVAIVFVNETQQFNSPVRLPYEYTTQITQSHILLANLLGDWTRTIAQKQEQFEIHLFEKVQTCTLSQSPTETGRLTLSDTLIQTLSPSKSPNQTLTASKNISNTHSQAPSFTPSCSGSLTDALSVSQTSSDSDGASLTESETSLKTASRSLSKSQTVYPVCLMNLHADSSSQAARYLVDPTFSVVNDLWTGLLWERDVSKTPMIWTVAESYCSSLSTAGYSDWRLPSVTELQSLVDYTIGSPGPAIDSTTFPNTSANQTWTSIRDAGNSGYYWVIDFLLAQISSDTGDNSKVARCVRGDSIVLLNRYVDENGLSLSNQSMQVRDVLTGLIWERSWNSAYVNWSSSGALGSAQAYCETLKLGASNWRMPTVKELTSLINYDSYSPAINSTAFPAPASDFFWTSTPCSGAEGQGWIVSFSHHALVECEPVVGNTNPVWCVRDSVWASEAYADATHQRERYIVAGNGTEAVVTDTFTGLIWEQRSATTAMTWENASSYCAGLVKHGLGCWRLPTNIELVSLLNYDATSRISINEVVFPGTSSSNFWTSVPTESIPENSWSIYFGYYGLGYVGYDKIAEANAIRCVRGSNNRPVDRYTDQNGGVLSAQSIQVKDQKTGLIWQRAQSSSSLEWNSSQSIGSAQSYCQNLAIASQGAGSWRLPSVKELATLVDYAVSLPSVNTSIFPETSSSTYAVSSQWGAATGLSYYVNFANGIVNGHYYIGYSDIVRCIFNSSSANNGMWSPLAYEDATHQTARYYISGASPNGIVTDDFTGLMWEQQVSGSTYFWNASAPSGSAQAYCANLVKGGYADWRLPTLLELQTLLDYTVSGNVAIESTAFPGTPDNYYWSSEPYVGIDDSAWYISFGPSVYYPGKICSQGYGSSCSTIGGGNIRCVRSSVSKQSTSERYVDEAGMLLVNASVQVKDLSTGLVWQRIATQIRYTWTSGKSYCNNLTIGGQVWRFPTIRELSTILNIDISQLSGLPMIDSDAFPETPAACTFTSTPLPQNSAIVWYIFFGSGRALAEAVDPNCYIRCVR